MIGKLKKIIASRSNINILTLFSGNAVAMLAQLAVSPLIARLYSPEDIGVYALVFSLVSVLTTIINGRYEMAILIPKSRSGTYSTFFLAIIVALAISIVLVPILIGFKFEISNLLNNPILADYLIYVPVILLLIGLYNPLKFYFIRHEDYKIVSTSQVSKSLTQSILQVSFGVLKFAQLGLILGFLMSQLAGNITLVKKFITRYKEEKVKRINIRTVKYVGNKYRDFLLYSSWGIFIPTLAQNITIFYISGLFGNENLGQYSFMQRYIAAPLIVISTTMSQVFMQELASKHRSRNSGLSVFYSYVKKLTFLGAIIMIPMYFMIIPVAKVLFGDIWTMSAIITKVSIPLFFIRFIAIPLQMVANVYEKHKLFIILQIITFIVTLSPIYLAQTYKMTMVSLIELQSYSIACWYLVTVFIYYRVLKKYKYK